MYLCYRYYLFLYRIRVTRHPNFVGQTRSQQYDWSARVPTCAFNKICSFVTEKEKNPRAPLIIRVPLNNFFRNRTMCHATHAKPPSQNLAFIEGISLAMKQGAYLSQAYLSIPSSSWHPLCEKSRSSDINWPIISSISH